MAQPTWSIDKVRSMSKKDIEALRDNALRKGASDVVAICDAVLAEQKPTRSKAVKAATHRKDSDYVLEYHFVCREDRGVTFLNNGTFKSASWVVALDEVEKSLRFGARFALHNSKQEPSYRQGEIVGFERIDNFEDGETKSRIDFLVKSDEGSMVWAGGGTGEKGYLWHSEVQSDAGN